MRFILVLALSLMLAPFVSGQCGNGKCEEGESKNNCLRDCRVASLEKVLENGGRVDWCPITNLIALDKRTGKHYDVYTMMPDGRELTCVTCELPGAPQKHNGQPTWHPLGEFLVYQAEQKQHRGRSRFAHPGRGKFNDLWVYHLGSKKASLLMPAEDQYSGGVLHPHFSHDGSMLSWTELIAPFKMKPKGRMFGGWKLKVADVKIEGGKMTLVNIRSYSPFGTLFYENHGFSPDGKELLFTSCVKENQSPLGGNQICKMNLKSEEVKVLTDEGYNEHAAYFENGKKILWGTNRGNKNKGMDYWVMNADGTQKQRLTWFNQKNSIDKQRGKMMAIDMSFDRAGEQLIFYVQKGVLGKSGDVYLLKFKK